MLDNWGMSVQSIGEIGKDLCPNVIQRFVENLHGGSMKTGPKENSSTLKNAL